MILKFRNKNTGQIWVVEHQDTIDRLKADAEFEQVTEKAPAHPVAAKQETAEEAPAKPTKSRKGSS